MKTLTPEQRMEGFIELETEIGEGGVGGAHLMSFLAGVAHAEKILGQEQDDEPVAWSEYDPRGNLCALHRSFGDGLSKAEIEYGWKLEPLYLHPAPRKQDDEPVATLDHNGNFELLRMVGVTYGQSINLYALEEKNK